jgi:hypothetical protein
MSAWIEVVITGHNFKSIYYQSTIHAIFALNWLTGYRGEDFVKTMSADCGHFEPRSWSLNAILEVDHLRTIDDMFALLVYWLKLSQVMAAILNFPSANDSQV